MGPKVEKRPSNKSASSKQKPKKNNEKKKEEHRPSTSKSQSKPLSEEKVPNSEMSRKSSKENSTKTIEEKEEHLERLLTALKGHATAENNEEYLEKVINSISNILQLEEAGDLDSLGDLSSKPEQNSQIDQAKENQEKEIKDQFCAFCKAIATTRCTGCRIVFYCDKECQKKDWNIHKDICRPYKIVKRRDVGRILIASRDLKADDLIVYETPLFLSVRPGLSGLICLSCYRRIDRNYRCSDCLLPVCSEKCQKTDDHSAFECSVLKGNLKQSPEIRDQLYDALTCLRGLISCRREADKWKTAMDRFNMQLLSMIGSSDMNREVQNVLLNELKARSYPGLSDISMEEIFKIMGLFQIHSVPTKLPYGEAFGLYSVASLLSHSCIPNTKLVWDKEKKKVKVTATEVIQQGAPITTIYTDILWGTRARRDHLQQTRLISCACARCRDPTELNTYFSALICPKCPKRNYVLPLNPLSNTTSWTCKTCEYQIGSEEVLQQTLSLGARVSESLQSPTIKSLEALQIEWLPKFSSNHYHLHAIKHSLLQLYGRSEEKQQEKSENHWEEIAKKEKACKEFLRVCALLDPALANTVPYVGLTFFEYHKTILQNAKRSFGLAKINTLQLKKRMLLSKELLRKAMDIFKNEEPDTPEGQLYITCQEERITIGRWMLAVGLV